MGFKLRREVRDLIPPGLLTARERCLVLEIADACDDDNRSGYPGAERLAERADMPASKVGDMLAKIAAKWVELRVPLGVGKDGRLYYSRPRKCTTYKFPSADELVEAGKKARAKAAEKAPQDGGPSKKAPRNGAPEAPESGGPEAPQNGVTRPPETGGPSPYRTPYVSPKKIPSPEREMPAKQASQRQTADEAGFEILKTRYGYNTAEAQHLISVLHRRYGIFSAEWWHTAHRNGSLSERITEVIEEYKLDVAARSAQSAA